MKFDYNQVWNDTLGLLRSHGALLAAIAGVFLFLPALLIQVLIPAPEPPQDPANVDLVLQQLSLYWRQIAPWVLVQYLLNLVGFAAMLRLIFQPSVTVGRALVFGLTVLPSLFLVYLGVTVMTAIGLLLIVPGLYLAGRLAPAPAILVAEERRGPIDIISRTFALTKGKGWSIFGLIFVVILVGWIITVMADSIVGILFLLIAGEDLGKLLTSVVTAGVSAAFATLLLILYAAIYRALMPSAQMAETVR